MAKKEGVGLDSSGRLNHHPRAWPWPRRGLRLSHSRAKTLRLTPKGWQPPSCCPVSWTWRCRDPRSYCRNRNVTGMVDPSSGERGVFRSSGAEPYSFHGLRHAVAGESSWRPEPQ